MSQLPDRIVLSRDSLLTGLGVIFAALLTMAYLVLLFSNLLPQWRARADLRERQALAEAEQTRRLTLEQTVIADVEARIGAAEEMLLSETAVFLTETQAATLLDSLNQHAITTGIEIVAVEALPIPPKEEQAVYDVRPFHVQARGELFRLLQFVGLVRETAVPSVAINNLTLAEMNGVSTLNFDLFIYTSPLADGTALANLPAEPLPDLVILDDVPDEDELPPNPVDALIMQLDAPWAAEDWPTVLSIIQQVIDLDPTYPNIREKQYSALVNYGYQLLEAELLEEARVQFETAVVLNPLSGEAQQGLSLLDQSQQSTYIVQRGDTLFSIARRFNTTVEAIRSANGLVGNTIYAGQELVIP